MKPSQSSFFQLVYAWLLLSVFAVSQLCPSMLLAEQGSAVLELANGEDGVYQTSDFHKFIALPSESAEAETEGEAGHEHGRELGGDHAAALSAHHEALNLLYGCSEASSARGHSAFETHSVDVPLFVFHHAWKIHLG